MKKDVLEFVLEKTKELMNAPTCSAETKEAAKMWMEAVGTDKEAQMTKDYIAELEEDIMPIDNLIAFAGSDAGKEYFGAETAAGIVSHAEEIKATGAKYCDCPACTVVEEILKKKEDILA